MVFVTVGTHEQPFNRLVEYMDQWAKTHAEEVIIQTGYSTYEPKCAVWKKLFPYQEMIENVKEARIVVSHGGPSSFIMPLQIGKIPVVVPRKKEYDEHVNDHQLSFSKAVAERQRNIIVVENIEELGGVLEHYNEITQEMTGHIQSNNDCFCKAFEELVTQLVK